MIQVAHLVPRKQDIECLVLWTSHLDRTSRVLLRTYGERVSSRHGLEGGVEGIARTAALNSARA